MRSAPLILVAALASACIAPAHRLTRIDPTPRAAVDTSHVRVLREEPEREFDVVALWEGEESSPYGDAIETLTGVLVREAAGLGADAVIVEADTDNGLPLRSPSMTPGVATGGLETTTFETVTRVKARIVVWRPEPVGAPPPR